MKRESLVGLFGFLLVFAWSGSAPAIDCANPTPLASITLTLNAPGGALDAQATLGFGALPTDCDTWVRFESTNFQALNPGFHNSFRGAGPHTMTVRSFAVNTPTTVTISAFTKTGFNANTQVGPTQSDTITVQPLPLDSLNVNRTAIDPSQGATGEVRLGGGTGGLAGLARVNLSANPAGALTIPAFVDVGDQVTQIPAGLTEYFKTFPITARDVATPTNVTISATRAGETRNRTIRVDPPQCRVTVSLAAVDTNFFFDEPKDDKIAATITNTGIGTCPLVALSMLQYINTTATGASINLEGPTQLEALAAGQQVVKRFVWKPVANSGPRTFQLVFGAGFPGIAPTHPSLVLTLTADQVTGAVN